MNESGAPLVALKAWTASFSYSVKLESGDPVWILKADPEFPGWWWCRGPGGEAAWIPEAFVEPVLESVSGTPTEVPGQGRMRRDYDSTELTVSAGERLVFLEEEAGWIRAEDSLGRRGWIPTFCLG